MRSIALRAFYRAKPLIPRDVQIAARKVRASRIWRHLDRDPLPPADIERGAYTWPAAQACALVTHDVETAVGQENISSLLPIEADFGIKSCWNFVVRRYGVDLDLIAHLRQEGHEIGVHGVYHDGRLFSSQSTFTDRLAIMAEAAEQWGATGFRSPSLNYDETLLRTMPFAWDSSMAAWDPFQPKPSNCLSYRPFALSPTCVELPVTLWQDFTLFDELGETDIDIWRRQIDFIYERGGLITVIAHPDYMLTDRRRGLYRDLLSYLSAKDALWTATPRDVVGWEHRRAASKRPEGQTWRGHPRP